jgi:hypothetical protein
MEKPPERPEIRGPGTTNPCCRVFSHLGEIMGEKNGEKGG